MKKKNYFIGLTLKNIHFFIFYGIITYIISKLVVQGSNLISAALDKVVDKTDIDLKSLIMWILVCIIVCMILGFLKKTCEEIFSIRIQKQCKNLAVENLPFVEYRFFYKNEGGIINKLTSDINDVTDFYSNVVPEILQTSVSIITYCIAIGKINIELLIGVLVCYPIVLFISNKIARKTIKLAKKRKSKFDTLVRTQEDSLAGISIERAYGLYDVLCEKVDKIINGILQNEFARNRYMAISEAVQLLVRWIPSIICSLIALYEAANGRVSIGSMMAFLILFSRISEPLSKLPFKINDAREMLVSIARINNVINAPKEDNSGKYTKDIDIEAIDEKNIDEKNIDEKNIDEKDTDEKDIDVKRKYIIELKNVSFGYSSDNNVINCMNFNIEGGKTTAIVGGSGAGKSTLIKILCGFERIDSGEYLLGGVKFQDWNLLKAREQIALVSQNTFLFPDTIAANVAYGKENASLDEIMEACKKAGIHDYIETLPLKYDTMLTERGDNLSGGQKQRISIARAIIKDCPIIIMDEPTSALDEKSEEIIKKSIHENFSNKTVIIIAHRLSTIVDADIIYVMKDGKIAESGTHKKLLNNKGIYAGFYSRENGEEVIN